MTQQNFTELFLSRYPDCKCIVLGVADCFGVSYATGALPAVGFDRFNSPNSLHALRSYFQGSNLCQNSASQYLARIKTIISYAIQLGFLPASLDLKPLNLRQFRSKGVYIDTGRLHELEQYRPATVKRADKLRSIRIAQLLALISARTGARASDVIRLTSSNIRNGLLTYVPKKTSETSGKICVVPIGPKTAQMVAEVTELAKDIDISTDKAEHAFYERYKRSLYHICQDLPWDEEVVIFAQNKQQIKPFKDCITTHTFRHSFATNMYLDEEVGGDIYAIAQMMGHSSVDMTMSYICVPFNEKKMCKVKYFE